MDAGLSAGRQAAEQMGIGIAAQQQRLIDQHGAVPHCRRAAETRQGHARHHGLDEEQQEGAAADGRHEQHATERGGADAMPAELTCWPWMLAFPFSGPYPALSVAPL